MRSSTGLAVGLIGALLFALSLDVDLHAQYATSGPTVVGATSPLTLTNGSVALPSWLSSGTSGGINYWSSSTAMTSSAALTQYGMVYGGGVGGAPVATAAGTASQVFIGGSPPVPGNVPAAALATQSSVTGFYPTLIGGSTSNTQLVVTAGTVDYFSAVGGSSGNTGETLVAVGVPRTGTAKNMYCTLVTAPGGATSRDLFLHDATAAANTTLTCNIAGVAVTCSDTTHTTASITAGHQLVFQDVNNGGAAATAARCFFEYDM